MQVRMFCNIKDNYRTNVNILKKVKFSDDLEAPQSKYGFKNLLNEQRNKIDKIDSDIWKKVRWYVNEYDFLVKDPIINRAFYKYWEILNEFNIFENFRDVDCVFHCAEAPGGFIQGTNIFLGLHKRVLEIPKDFVDNDGFTSVSKKRKSDHHRIFTISLNKDLPRYKSYNLPSYNQHIINKYTRITYGKDNTGDINNLENIDHVQSLLDKSTSKDGFYLITADGGFDEGNDFNNKEQLHYSLILCEIYSVLTLQKQGGCFILKMFDVFTETSIHLLYLLNTLYGEIYIYKPKTSRPTNSEKYVICKNMTDDIVYKNKAKNFLKLLSEKLKKTNSKYGTFHIFDTIPDSFVEKIFTMNTQFLEKQCSYLQKAIYLCEDSNFLSNYDSELDVSIQKRVMTFNAWQDHYKLSSFIG